MNGAISVFEDAGIAIRAEWNIESLYSLSDAKQAVAAILQAPECPTALLCGNDVLAVGACYAAHKMGIGVPGDISIIGIGDFKGSEDMSPALTTVRVPAKEIGDLAGQHLSALIIGNPVAAQRVSCEISLKLRETCAQV
jgi:LacI family transcriptional regulator